MTEFLKTPGCAKGPHSIVRLEDESEYISSQIIGDDDDKNYAELNPKVSENDIACKNRISEDRAARLERFFQIFTEKCTFPSQVTFEKLRSILRF